MGQRGSGNRTVRIDWGEWVGLGAGVTVFP